MLELRPTCENCKKGLPFDSQEAMICTFECTFCKNCVVNVLKNVCPNCGGNFVQRPIRPQGLLKEHPVSDKIIYRSVDVKAHNNIPAFTSTSSV